MRRATCLSLAAILGFGLFGWLQFSHVTAQEPAAKQEPAASDAEEVIEVDADEQAQTGPAIPDELHDAAFESHVSPTNLAAALDSLDPALLADVSLQLAEGERILGRANTVTPAERIFGLAVRTAAERGDKQTLERLASRAKALDRKDLSGIVAAAAALAGAARNEDPAKKLGLEEGSEAREVFDLLVEDINSARLLGNAGALDGIEDGLETFDLLNAEQIKYLRDLIAEARKGLDKEPNPELEAMQKLAGVSRASGATVNERVYNYCAGKLTSGVTVLRGECAELPVVAFVNAGAKDKIGSGDDDYVWGTLKHNITSTSTTKAAKNAIRGDVLQYRDAKWAHGNATYSARHHTSVVKSVEQSGKYIRVLQQNSGGKRYTTEGVVWLPGLKAGWIKFYRPISASRTFSVNIKNAADKKISFQVAGKPYSLDKGVSKTYSVTTSTGNVSYGIDWPTYTSGGIGVGGAEAGYLEGRRKYEFRGSKGNYDFVKVGWN